MKTIQKILINPVLCIRKPTDAEMKKIRRAGYPVSAVNWRLLPVDGDRWAGELAKEYRGEFIGTGVIVTL